MKVLTIINAKVGLFFYLDFTRKHRASIINFCTHIIKGIEKNIEYLVKYLLLII